MTLYILVIGRKLRHNVDEERVGEINKNLILTSTEMRTELLRIKHQILDHICRILKREKNINKK